MANAEKDFTPKHIKEFICDLCDFTCSKNSDWLRHISTLKHTKANQQANPATAGVFKSSTVSCEYCEKKFNHSSSLCRHKKTCNQQPIKEIKEMKETKEGIIADISNLTNLVLEVVKSNNEFQKQMFDYMKNNTSSNINSHNTTNTNHSNNKTFNLQFFLNETCKDAMNIMDFVDNMKIELTDLENIAQVGYVKGMSNLILKNLKALDVTQRPVHCSDSKREVVYVKDNNEWHNDQKEGEVPNQKLKKAIKHITNKNMKMIPQWKEKYPDCIYADSRKSTLYNNMYYHTVDSSEEHSEKIIKNIAKEVIIQK
jgi:hypothetical protein